MKNLLHIFNNFQIKKKLLCIYFLFELIPFLGLVSYSSYQTYHSLESEHQQVLEADNRRVKNTLFETVYLFTNFVKQIQRDDQFETLLTTQYEQESDWYYALRQYENLNFIKQNFSEVSDIHIFSTNPTIQSSGYFQQVTQEIEDSAWYQRVISKTSDMYWFYDTTICDYGSLHLAKSIQLTPNEYAVMVITVSNYSLSRIMQDSKLSAILVLDGETIFYSDLNLKTTNFNTCFDNDIITPQQHIQYTVQNKSWMLYASEFQGITSDNRFSVISVNTYALQNTRQTTFRVAVLMFGSMLLPFCAIFLFVHNFNKRLSVLKSQMENITSENYEILSWKDSADEFGILFQQMLKTIGSIQILTQRVYQEELKAQKLELLHNQMQYKMLASQINPHFLLNSLETVHMKAEDNEDFEVSYLSELLGELLQYSLQVKDRCVSLEEELSYAEKYLKFQKIRLDNQISYQLLRNQVDTNTYQIPPMLLQPILENSIQHGYDSSVTDYQIHIQLKQDKKFLYITISDNGLGMESSVLKKQLDLLRTPETPSEDPSRRRPHLGLANIYQRIKLFFGEDYTLTVDSEPLRGTTVTLYLPPFSDKKYFSREEQ